MATRVTQMPDLMRMWRVVEDRMWASLDDVMFEASEKMRNLIETRGTGKTWTKPWGGRSGSIPGRVDSGYMRDQARYELRRNGSVMTGVLGWTDNQEMYFIFQDEGFTHWLTGDDIKGMNALVDSGIWAREELLKRLMERIG